MDGRINVAEAPEIMVSRRPPNPVEKANPAWMPRPNSPLENTPHKARVVGDGADVRTDRTGPDVRLERPFGKREYRESFPLLWGERVSPPSQKIVSICAEDIGHFEPMLFIARVEKCWRS